MPSITLKSMQFGVPPFRKLGAITIDFAERITVVAGHNGIGKSTILGLVSNSSGLSDATQLSYLNRTYQGNLNDIIHLDYVKEYEDYKKKGLVMPAPTVTYDVDGLVLVKRSTITVRNNSKKIRVVPRNDPHKAMLRSNGLPIGPDAKVPLPTIYLGMTRMLPVGESNPLWIKNTVDKTIDAGDAAFIQSFIDGVIGGGTIASKSITTQSIKGTGKIAKHPDYAYSAKCISLGQDSLSAIATAMASFRLLKRNWPDYPGGLLVIDEIDAGFHPHAQQKLIKLLKNAAKTLNVQVVATTHSVCLIEAIHPESNPVGGPGKHVDKVIYITDTVAPRVADGYALKDIQADMYLTPPVPPLPAKARQLKVYLEDPEAEFFLRRLLTPALKKRVKTATGFRLKPIGLSIGCNNLMGLHKHDAHFRTVMIVVDADASIAGAGSKIANIVKLPGGRGHAGAGYNPERTAYEFIGVLAGPGSQYPVTRAALQAQKITRDMLREHLLDGETNIADRKSAKSWMTKHLDRLAQWKIFEYWLTEHPNDAKKFSDAFLAAAMATAKLN